MTNFDDGADMALVIIYVIAYFIGGWAAVLWAFVALVALDVVVRAVRRRLHR